MMKIDNSKAPAVVAFSLVMVVACSSYLILEKKEEVSEEEGTSFGVYKPPRAYPIVCEMVSGFLKAGVPGALGYNQVWAEVDLDRRVGQDGQVGYFFVVYKGAMVKPCNECRDASDCVRSLRYENLCFREKKVVSFTGVFASHLPLLQGLMGRSPMDREPPDLPGLDYILAGFKEACRNGIK
jgi:hypothetical protein